MTMRVTIDQISPSGGSQRYEHESNETLVLDAIDEAFEAHGMTRIESGQYQITITTKEAA